LAKEEFYLRNFAQQTTKKVTIDENGNVTKDVTSGTFSEGLLRNITTLTDEQQTELVSKLAKGGNCSLF